MTDDGLAACTALPRPRFDELVPPDGYRWWYVDALSDDHRNGLTLIIFIGSVFSPYYFNARRKGRGDPENHCAFNVALYGQPNRWTMTERGRTALRRDDTSFTLGPSRARWDGEALIVDVEEIAVPIPRRVRGRITVLPEVRTAGPMSLDPAGRHRWWPIAPRARVTVALESPRLSWSGPGYFDSNEGDEPLEAGFTTWTWSRAHLGADTVILYESRFGDGAHNCLSLAYGPDGQQARMDDPPLAALPDGLWKMRRETRCEPDATPRIVQSLEDSPFYTRSVLETRLRGRTVRAVHESLSLERFVKPWVRGLLPFRMPRRDGPPPVAESAA